MRTTGPKRNPPLCACGCGAPVTKKRGKWNRFIYTHNVRQEHNPNWKGGVHLQKALNRYAVSVGKGPAIKRARLVMEQHLGRKLLSSEIVHHKDEDSTNDAIDNLEILTRAEHASLHHKGVAKPAGTGAKISKARMGHGVSEETRKKISETKKRRNRESKSPKTRRSLSSSNARNR